MAAKLPRQPVGVPIDTSAPRLKRSRHRVSPQVIATAASAVAALLVLAILYFAGATTGPAPPDDQETERGGSSTDGSRQPSSGPIQPDTPSSPGVATGSAETASREATIPDDGQSLWASPTSGPPLSLRYLPIGAQIFIALRPADLAGHADGDKVLASLGPATVGWYQWVERLSGFPLETIEQLIIGLGVGPSDLIDTTLVLRPRKPVNLTQLASRHAQAVTATHAGATYLTANPWALYLPPDEAGRTVVIASARAMPEIIDAAGPPPLRRAMEQLLAATDSRRTLTLLGAPNYLLTDAAMLLAGPAQGLRRPLDWFLRDPVEALSVSVHLGDNLFLELRAIGPVDRSPQELAQRLHDRLEQVPDQVELHLTGLNLRPYGRRILSRYPQMLRLLTNYTRTGAEHDQALLRCYLPASAAHNLLMGLDLALSEGTSTATTADAPTPAPPASVADRLARKTTLQFDRNTLEHAVELLSNDIGVPITILGSDLQLEGITKNQSFGIDVQDESAEGILQRILLLANPDKTVTKIADPRQTLVYVIRPGSPGQAEMVVVTTRTQAAARGEKLPKAFVAQP